MSIFRWWAVVSNADEKYHGSTELRARHSHDRRPVLVIKRVDENRPSLRLLDHPALSSTAHSRLVDEPNGRHMHACHGGRQAIHRENPSEIEGAPLGDGS